MNSGYSFFSFHEMKKIVYLLVFALLITACHFEPLNNKSELKIVVASDIHYFLKEYYKDCDWFEESVLQGDGKMVTYCDEIVDAFIKDVEKINPDLVILTGDLSFYGEKGSHETLAKKLLTLKDKGIHVAVIPGNHDIDSIYAKGYGKDDFIKVDNVNAEMFKSIYKDLGYDISYHQHRDSLSYSIQLNHKYTLFMMDSTAHQLTGSNLDIGGYFTESTMEWLEDELKSVKDNDRIPIVAMHHNLAIHNNLINQGYTIKDYQTITKLFQNYQVPFVLTGHIHCQNIREVNGIYDIASSSLLDAPLQYGVMTLKDNSMEYHTQSLKISQDANEYFDLVSSNKFAEAFEVIKDKKIREEMKEVVVKANRYYFAGNIFLHIDELKNMKGYAYFYKEEGEKLSFYKGYLENLMSDTNNNQSLNLIY